MGDPRKIRRKFTKPRHPWQSTRLEDERTLLKEYGLKNKKQLWKMTSMLTEFTNQAKSLNSKIQTQKSSQAEKEKDQFIARLSGLGLLSVGASLGDVLNLTLRDILERRLQTLVFKKSLSRSVDQARQFITHGHIAIDGKKITSPSYLVRVSEESLLGFVANSQLNDPQHPERAEVAKPAEKKASEKAESSEAKEEKPEAAEEAKPVDKPKDSEKKAEEKVPESGKDDKE